MEEKKEKKERKKECSALIRSRVSPLTDKIKEVNELRVPPLS